MSSTNSRNDLSPSARGLMALGLALLFSGLLICMSALVYSGPATATTPPAGVTKIVDGQLDWAFIQALETAGAAKPSISADDGAIASRDGTLRFPNATGSYDATSGTATVRYRGTVVLTYPGSRVTLANLTVVLAGSQATLRATVGVTPDGAARGTPSPTAPAAIGDLKTYGIPPRTSGRTLSWTQVPAALSAAGAEALPQTFEGTEVGPMNWSITLQKAAATPTTVQPKAAASTPSTPAPTPSDSPTGCETPTASPTASPSPTPTDTDCATPTPSESSTDTETPAATPNSGDDDRLPKTGSRLAPLMTFGGILTALGGGTMLVARRRGFTTGS
jgi:LPXTG-motif cell wall-anchored protein